MKKLILALLFIPMLASAQMMPQQGGTGSSLAPTVGQVLVGLSTGKYTPRATSTLGLMGFAYASSTFPTFDYASSTFMPFTYASSTFVNFTYASSTFPSFTYATSTFATSSGLYSNFVRFTYATSTFVPFSYATSTFVRYSYATSTFVPFSYATSTFAPFAYGTSSYVTVINNQTVAGAKTFSGTTTLATSTATLFTVTGKIGVGTTSPIASVVVATGSIYVADVVLATSTTMSIDMATTSNTLIMPIGTAAITVTFANVQPGQQKVIQVINPPTGTAGAITWTGCAPSTGAMPTQTTTAGKYDIWSFKVVRSTTSPYTGTSIACALTPNF